MNVENEKKFVIKTYNSKELAALYGVSTRTFRRWLVRAKLDLGPKLGSYFTPRQVKIIFDNISAPFIWLFSFLIRLFFGADDVDDNHDDAGGKLKG